MPFLKAEQLSLVQIELQVLCQHPMREDGQTFRRVVLLPGFQYKTQVEII